MTIKKKHYSIIRPTEEETQSTNVLNLYETLCDYLTLPWILVGLGIALYEYRDGETYDPIYLNYIDRVTAAVADELGERANWNINAF